MAVEWPTASDVWLSQRDWRQASPLQRQELCQTEDDDVVLHFRMRHALLKQKTQEGLSPAESAAAVAVAEAQSGMSEIHWHVLRPRKAQLSLRFCASPLALDAMLTNAVGSMEELAAVLRDSRQVQDSAGDTWERLAVDFFSVVVFQLVVRCRRLQANHLPILVEASRFKFDAPARRSWPPRRVLAELRARWPSMTGAERVMACTIGGDACWLPRACNVAVCAEMTRRYVLLGDGPLVSVAESARLRLDGVHGFSFDEEKLSLRLSFAEEAGSLEHMLRLCAQTVLEHEHLLALTAATSKEVAAVADLQLPTAWPGGWRTVAGVAFTLFVAGLVYLVDRSAQEEAAEKARQAAREAAREARKGRRKKTAVKKPLKALRSSPLSAPVSAPCWERLHYTVRNTFVHVDEEAPPSLRRSCSSLW